MAAGSIKQQQQQRHQSRPSWEPRQPAPSRRRSRQSRQSQRQTTIKVIACGKLSVSQLLLLSSCVWLLLSLRLNASLVVFNDGANDSLAAAANNFNKQNDNTNEATTPTPSTPTSTPLTPPPLSPWRQAAKANLTAMTTTTTTTTMTTANMATMMSTTRPSNVISALSDFNKNSLRIERHKWPRTTTQPCRNLSALNAREPTTAGATDFASIETAQSKLSWKERRDKLLLLHRHKRYLLFPEGSSFQMVFDLIIPIVDYTNFAIMGITCAVAWELPSKPPSELIENVRTRLKDGTLGVVRRNDTVDTPAMGNNNDANHGPMYNDNNNYDRTQSEAQAQTPSGPVVYYAPMQAQPQKQSTIEANGGNVGNGVNGGNDGMRPAGYANGRGQQRAAAYNGNWQQTADSGSRYSKYDDDYYRPRGAANLANGDNNWWQRNKERIEQNWQKNQQKWSKYVTPQHQSQVKANEYSAPAYASNYVRYNAYNTAETEQERSWLQAPPNHRIYPVYGRRRRRRRRHSGQGTSADDNDNDDDDDVDEDFERLHLRVHLRTRQQLFRKIERLYKARNLDGTACVLRALCESGQRGDDDAPQSFIMELLGAIFRLPPDEDMTDEHMARHYREAYNADGSCRELFAECGHGFWQE